jgi:predicted dehydrogenase
VDALQFLTDSRPKRLWTSAIPAGGAIAHEENFVLNIEYQNGSLGTIIFSALGNPRLPQEYLEIYGDGKVMTINNFKNAKLIFGNKTKNLSLWREDKGYIKEMELIINAIREGQPSPMSPQELYDSHISIFKVMEAIETGKIVEF